MCIAIGRRSIKEESRISKRDATTIQPKPLTIKPTPFNVVEHGARYRRQYCGHQEYQHILLVLDTSGSIGQIDFDRVTAALGQLVPLFCSPIKIAAMTFDHEYFEEFCFDDYDNTASGRQDAGAAVGSIPYIRPGQGSGTRWTHTAGAAQCVCDYIFRDRGCGIGQAAAPYVDVVFFTDGKANDPVLDVCETVTCLHGISNVNTYTLAVGDSNDLKLDCMEENDLELDEYHLFDFETIEDLEEQLEEIFRRLITDPVSYPCVSTCVDPGM